MTVNGNEIVLLVALKNSAGRPSGPALPFRFKALTYLLISAGVKKTGGTAEVVNWQSTRINYAIVAGEHARKIVI